MCCWKRGEMVWATFAFSVAMRVNGYTLTQKDGKMEASVYFQAAQEIPHDPLSLAKCIFSFLWYAQSSFHLYSSFSIAFHLLPCSSTARLGLRGWSNSDFRWATELLAIPFCCFFKAPQFVKNKAVCIIVLEAEEHKTIRNQTMGPLKTLNVLEITSATVANAFTDFLFYCLFNTIPFFDPSCPTLFMRVVLLKPPSWTDIIPLVLWTALVNN